MTQARVWKGSNKEVALGLANDLFLTVSASQAKNIQKNIVLDTPLKAPIVKGQAYGTLNVTVNNQVLASKPIIALENDPKGPFWRSMADSMSYTFHKMFTKSKETLNND